MRAACDKKTTIKDKGIIVKSSTEGNKRNIAIVEESSSSGSPVKTRR